MGTSSYDGTYGKTQYLLAFDQHSAKPAWLKSIEMPLPKANVVTEKVGLTMQTYKHLALLELGETTAELGMVSRSPVIDWIKDSLDRKFSRRTGSVVYADQNRRARWRQEFRGALLSEITFPALEAGGKNAGFMTVKWRAESTAIVEDDKKKITAETGSDQRLYANCNFRLDLGKDLELETVTKVEALNIKQSIKELRFGSKRHAELEPVGMEYGNLVFTIPLRHAKSVLKWHDDSVRKGIQDTKQEKQGSLTFLSQNNNTELLKLELTHVGVFSAAIDKAEASSNGASQLKVECYVEQIKIG